MGSDEDDSASAKMVSLSARRAAVWAGAGCGKTGTCCHVALLHSEGQLWPFFDALLQWRLRDPTVQKATTLVQLLVFLLPDTSLCKVQEIADHVLEREGRGILVVLDGVDELIEHDYSFVCRILDGDILTEACVLASSRPCAAARNYFDYSVFDVNVELLGFSEQQADSFIEEQLGPGLAPKLKDLLDRSPGVASLMSVPLMALIICQVFKTFPDILLSTRTRLYSVLILLVVRHAVCEKRVKASDSEQELLKAARDVRKFPEGVAEKLLTDHAKVAWAAYKKDKAVFDIAFIMKEVSWESDDPLAIGLLGSYYSTTVDGLQELRHYSFQHLTFQEFLAAFYLTETVQDESELTTTLTDLCADTHSFVVLRFLAGLLKKEHHPFFFCYLNQWLHSPCYDSEMENERLRVVLQCAQEASDGDDSFFPEQLELPEDLYLDHVTAADLTMLSSAITTVSSLQVLWLEFDEVRKESGSKKWSRVKRQTCTAMASLTAAIRNNTSLQEVNIWGPHYQMVDGKSLANLVMSHSLTVVQVWHCGIGDSEVGELSAVLRENTHSQLEELDLSNNQISDAGVHELCDALKDNVMVNTLYLYGNQLGPDTAQYFEERLKHVRNLPLVL